MFTPFPDGSRARVVQAYRRPYEAPFRAEAGAAVRPDFGPKTDIEGWIWAEDPEGRGGWTPLAWLDRSAEPWRLTRDFDALELTVAEGEEVTLHFAESGFVLATTADGETGWLPDGVLERLP
ncbi:peptide-binding protein [Algihabitans albus]|uniref:peptide-binding protein n=1 Tax=Algihabitans albus TaxID=2164067 RepID=UPI000E5C8F20|nr:peptide-binding protein [Algihabitans albus]